MITIFQHGSGEPPGYLLELMMGSSCGNEIIPVFQTGEVPEQTGASHLVFLGGQMSVNDEKEYPWLIQEKKLIRDAIRSGVPVLGICLGAQLIASALHKKVYPCHKERGWCTIRKNPSSGHHGMGDELTVFQWHGECVELPDGSDLVYLGDRVQNQMFQVGSATGVQFHPEVTDQIINEWVLSTEPGVRNEILLQTPGYIRVSKRVCRAIVTRFLSESFP
jgi:GMP synthase (glutamine-hydrolysing)